VAVKNPVITDSVKSGEPAHMFLSMNTINENKALRPVSPNNIKKKENGNLIKKHKKKKTETTKKK
ncbi:hypothetical protein J9A71_28670, partial [Klebsiella pneumoniae]